MKSTSDRSSKRRLLYLVAMFCIQFQIQACPTYSLADTTVTDLKRGCTKYFWTVIRQIDALQSAQQSGADLKAPWSNLSGSYLVFRTRLENWIRLLPEDMGREDWYKALAKFSSDISALVPLIRNSELQKFREALADYRCNMVLFFHWNPLEGTTSAVAQKDKALYSRVASDLKRLDSKTPTMQEFYDKFVKITDSFDDTKEIESFTRWSEFNSVNLKKEFADYFEKNTWF
ncbi:MAG: hypothetical protein PHQ23_09060 [Candidatus Wallbacteria bacterium]|nr:hypothetical protein [Candidatus Wallbacteria bacterium]